VTSLTWLHLSDWHQKGKDFDRRVVRDALLKDIEERVTRIDPTLERVDFVVFSGDLVWTGKPDEYQAAQEHLLAPALTAAGLKANRLFIVPGNHDLNRTHVYEMLPPELQKPLDSDALVQKWLNEEDGKRERTLEPFAAYRDFVAKYTGQSTPDYASILRLNVGGKDDGKKVALLGLNSAWMCARHKDNAGEVDDARRILVGEPQIHAALAEIANADVRIAVLHHPFEWLADFDRSHIKNRLRRECHFILTGHEHCPQLEVVNGPGGYCVTIPAGASYNRRVAEHPRNTNAYSWVHLEWHDKQKNGVIYQRRWNDDGNKWQPDDILYTNGKHKFCWRNK